MTCSRGSIARSRPFPCGVLLLVAWGSLLLWSGAGRAAAEDDDSRLEQRVRALSLRLRCLVCQNETLADSRADLADDLRREIRDQMKAGRTDEQIVAFLTERYGDFVLYRPPLKPTTYALWFGPFLLLGGGLRVLYRQLTGRRPSPPHDRPLARRRLTGRMR